MTYVPLQISCRVPLNKSFHISYLYIEKFLGKSLSGEKLDEVKAMLRWFLDMLGCLRLQKMLSSKSTF